MSTNAARFRFPFLLLIAPLFVFCLPGPRCSADSSALTLVTFTAHVLNMKGNPVAGASVAADLWEDNADKVKTVTTDSAGAFSLTARFDPDDQAAVSCIVQAAGYGIGGGTLKPRVDNILHLSPPLTLTGTVVDASGRAVPGVKVRFQFGRIGDDRVYIADAYGLGDKFAATSDTQGHYIIAGAPSNAECGVRLEDPRFVLGAASAKLGSGSVPPITAKPCAMIVGRVLYQGGKPVSGIVIIASPTSPYADGSNNAHATTAADGSYRLTGLPAGAYRLQAQTDWYLSKNEFSDWITPLGIAVTAAEGKDNSAPDVILIHGGIISGTVVDAQNGAPIPDVQLSAQTPESGGRTIEGVTTTTDAQGRYNLHAWPGTDSVFIQATPEDYIGSYQDTDKQAEVVDGATVTVPPISLKRGGTITGTAIDENGAPVAGLDLTPFGTAHGYPEPMQPGNLTTTDSTGAFTIHKLPDGDYTIRPGAKWRVVSPDKVTVPTADVVKLVLRPRKLTTLAGKVIDTSGAPVAGVTMAVTVNFDYTHPGQDSSYTPVTTAANGAFTVNDIPIPGGEDDDSQVGVQQLAKPGYTLVSGGDIQRVNGSFVFTTAVMSAQNGSVSGIVVNGLKAPVNGAWVACSGGSPDKAPEMFKTDATGKFHFENQTAGPITVYAAKGAYSGETAAQAVSATAAISPQIVKVLLSPNEPRAKPADFELATQLLQNVAAAGATSDANETTGNRNTCAEQLGAYNPELGIKFLKDSGASVGSGDILTILQGRIAMDPQAAFQWGYNLVQTMMPEDAYKYRAQIQLGLAILPFAPDKAGVLYDAARQRFKLTSYDWQSSTDAMQLCALATALHKPEAGSLYKSIIDYIDDMRKQEKSTPNTGGSQADYEEGQFAETMAIANLRDAEQILQLIPLTGSPAEHRSLIEQMAAKLAPIQPLAAVELFDSMRKEFIEDSPDIALALQHVLPIIYKADPKHALALADTLPQSDLQASSIAVVAELTPTMTQAVPLYRAAESQAVDQHGSGYTPVRIASLAYRRDKALGLELFKKALADFNSAPRSAQNYWGEPSAAEFGFYYSVIDPAYSRVLIERQFAADQVAAKENDWQTNQALAADAAAMAAIDVTRANEMAFAIKLQRMRFTAALRVAQYVIARESVRETIPFGDWTTLDNWIPGTPDTQ